MSGLEVIGIILGIYPMIQDALAVYKATKAGKAALSLIRGLKLESIIFNEFVYHLLAPNVSEEDLVRLKNPGPDIDLWKNATLQANLQRRLGAEKAELVGEILLEIKELLNVLELELSPDVSEHRIELLRKFRTTVRNVKQNLPQSPIRDRLNELTAYNIQLQRLLSDRSLPSNTTSTPGRVAPKKYLRRDHNRAQELYDAVCNGYQCKCKAPHVANFSLPRLSDNFKADNNGFVTSWQFEFLFPADDIRLNDDDSKSALELDQLVENWSELGIDAANVTKQEKLERQRSHSICLSECNRRRSGGQQLPIPDLCYFVKSLGSDVHVLNTSLGILRVAEKQYDIQVPGTLQNTATSHNIVCLNELLTNQRFSLTRKERMNLALRLSYAILEFYSTPWIEACWTWKNFFIDKHNNAQLFVTQKFYSSHSRSSSSCSQESLRSAFWAIHGEPILTRLGFALIELAMSRRLADLRRKKYDSNLDPDTIDFLTAKDVIDSGLLLHEEGQDYEDVVKTCLNREFLRMSELVKLDSRRPTFHDNVEERVIAPLHNIWTANWGNHGGTLPIH